VGHKRSTDRTKLYARHHKKDIAAELIKVINDERRLYHLLQKNGLKILVTEVFSLARNSKHQLDKGNSSDLLQFAPLHNNITGIL
jgi:hypothetical protein